MSDDQQDDKLRCFSGKWSTDRPRCPNRAVWRSLAPLTEHMVWCAEHAPHPKYCVPLEVEGER